ncbi:MAG TPA: tetratricopeptide repeat protein, partial [Verrucomicrobiae bacterium]
MRRRPADAITCQDIVNTSSMSLHLQPAILLMEQGRYLDAEVRLRELIANSPVPSAAAQTMLGLCLYHSGVFPAARAAIQTALAIDANYAHAHYALSFVAGCSDRPSQWISPAARLRHVQRALELHPAEPSYLLRLAELHQETRQWQRSLPPILEVRRLWPQHPGAAVLQAEALIHLGRRDEARQILHTALTHNPEAARTHAGMGWTLLRSGDHQGAAAFFDEALRLRPGLDWAQAGALACAKHEYQGYRWLTYTDYRFHHRPLLKLLLDTSIALAWLLAVIGLLFWLDPLIRPHWGALPLVILMVPLMAAPFVIQYGTEPFYNWRVRRHRAAQLSSTAPILARLRRTWRITAVILLGTAGLAGWYHFSHGPLVFGVIGLTPGALAWWAARYEVPPCPERRHLVIASVVILILGPGLLIWLRRFILETAPDPRCAVLLAVPAIIIGMLAERLKIRQRIKEHHQSIAS